MLLFFKKTTKIIFLIFFVISLSFFLFSSLTLAGDVQVTLIQDYTIGGEHILGDGTSADLSSLLRTGVKLAIGFGVILAVILLVVGGVQYATVDTFTGKASGKETIQNALIGLLLIFVSFLILIVINPNLLNDEVSLTDQSVKFCKGFNNNS